jgi:hypothetical protein
MRAGKRIGWLVLAGLLSMSAAVWADDYYLTGDQAVGSWDTLTSWTNSAGANPVSIAAADDYYLDGFVVRTPTGDNPVFAGNALYIDGGAILFKQTDTVTITNLFCSGGNLNVGNAMTTQTLHAVNMSVTSFTRLGAGAHRGLALQVDTLTGTATFKTGTVTSDTGYYSLSIADASGFSGTFQVVFGTIDFKNDVNLPNGTFEIVPAGGAVVVLDQDLTVKTLIIGEDTLNPGTYSFAELNAAYDAQFADGGTGSITVLNEKYYLKEAMGSNKSWNNLDFWTNSVGASPASIDVGDDYYTDGFLLRSPAGGGSFAANLTLNSQLAFVTPDTYSIQKLTAVGGTKMAGFSGTVTVHVVEFDVQEYTKTYSDAGKGLDFHVGTLSGGGIWADADKTDDLGYRGISVTNGLAYTGELRVVWGTTDFNNDLDIRNGTLSISTAGAGSVILDQDVIVGSLVIGTQTYEDGTYSFADLNAAYDAQFVDGGTGSIQVGFNEASFAGWLEGFPTLSGSDADQLADPDVDGLNNLMEYALGGMPDSADADSISPEFNMISADGTNWLYYTYRRRLDAGDRSLIYEVLAGESLLGTGLTDETEEAGSVAIDSDFEIVSNRVSTAAAQTFVTLKITSDE